MQRSVPDCSAGFSRLEASIAPPLVAPAPITVWISSMNRMAFGCVLELLHHRLQPLLEVAAIAGAGEQRAHVEREDRGLGQHAGRLAVDDLAGEALGDRRLADARVADQERVVLAPAAEHLDAALDLEIAADQGIDVPAPGLLVQIDAVLLQCASPRLPCDLCRLRLRSPCGLGALHRAGLAVGRDPWRRRG